MSIYHVSKALKTNYKTNTKLVLIVLCDCADEDGYCYPSYSHIQKHASISGRSTVSENLKKLENDGIIKRTTRFNDTNFYQVFPHESNNGTSPICSESNNWTSPTTSTLTTKNIKEQSVNSKKFTKPTEDEVENYCNDKNYDYKIADGFIDFYDSKNWMVGKNKMTSWKGALSGWIKRGNKDSSSDLVSLRLKHNGYSNDFVFVTKDGVFKNQYATPRLSEAEERRFFNELSQ